MALGKNKRICVYFSPLVGQIRIDIRLWKTAVNSGYKMNPDGANLSLIRFNKLRQLFPLVTETLEVMSREKYISRTFVHLGGNTHISFNINQDNEYIVDIRNYYRPGNNPRRTLVAGSGIHLNIHEWKNPLLMTV